jgi:hypothetical protein
VSPPYDTMGRSNAVAPLVSVVLGYNHVYATNEASIQCNDPSRGGLSHDIIANIKTTCPQACRRVLPCVLARGCLEESVRASCLIVTPSVHKYKMF